MDSEDPVDRRRLAVVGTVQGVGFRPFVYREARALGLHGTVANDAGGVVIDVEGTAAEIDELCRRLVDRAPPRARVASVESTPLAPSGRTEGFRIVASSHVPGEGQAPAAVGVDLGICTACLGEVHDHAHRRYRYPFTNCTDCGPRYTIVRAVPYDRPTTTMAAFTMCAECQREYDDPADRRFHAQPNACPACGPTLRLLDPSGEALAGGGDPIDRAGQVLLDGGIVGVKGVGGYHLAVDAGSERSVRRLRTHKHRDDKPFAVMAADEFDAAALAEVSPVALDALTSWRRPVVLCPRRGDAPVAGSVAQGLPELGLVLAYTGLHHLLLEAVGRPLVMTSANLSDEPIVYRDRDAADRLAPLVDAVLTHDRPIHVPCEDSVVRATRRGPQVLRRGRGFAPEPLTLPLDSARQVLAVGAELKSTVSVVKGRMLVTGPHIGDLGHPAAFAAFDDATRHLCELFGVAPDLVVHDLHPEYLSTKWARDTDLPTLAVQHHHAHVASCLVDHERADRVLGVAFDGLGLGDDGTLWGGEFLVADLAASRRVGHLLPVWMPGGAQAVREPWRMAVAWLCEAVGPEDAMRIGERLDPRAAAVVDLIRRSAAADATTTPTRIMTTTSMGRLFDAIAALLGVRASITYEGQAAIELEALAHLVPRAIAPWYPVDLRLDDDPAVLDPRRLVAAVVAARDAGVPPATISAGVHESIGVATAELAARLAHRSHLRTVALTGGVFQNGRLAEVVADELERRGLEVLAHRRVPPNDGGISVGQAAIAAAHRGPLPS